MINFRRISFEKAMELISDNRIKDLYFMDGRSFSCADDFQINMSDLKKMKWLEKEEITNTEKAPF